MHRPRLDQPSSPAIGRLLAGALACVVLSSSLAWGTDEPSPPAWVHDAHRIEDQPGAHRQVLDNGMELVVIGDNLQTPITSPADEQAMQCWLIVRAGSLYESSDQRGAARVLEEVIRMGTLEASAEHISSLLLDDVSWDTDLPGSFVGFDQAAFIAEVNPSNPAAMTHLIEFYTSLLDGHSLMLNDERIEQAIGRVIQKIKDEPNPEQRSRRRWLPRLMVGTPFGDRTPSPALDTLARLSPQAVRAFSRQAYHPSQATLLVVGRGDLSTVREQLERQCSSIPESIPPRMVDARNHFGSMDSIDPDDSSMRAVLDVDPGFEESQAAMIWFHDRPSSSMDETETETETWDQRARSYGPEEMRETVINRIAGEVIRYRLGRLVSGQLGVDTSFALDQVDLWGQVDLMQAVVSGGSLDWESAMRTIVGESHRLATQGVSTDEIKRARRSVLSRWHRDAQNWSALDAQGRVGLYHWLVTTGRPIIGMDRWDAIATEMLTQITDQQIRESVQSLTNPRQATFVVLTPQPQDPNAIPDAMVARVVKNALAEPFAPLDPSWFEQFVGSLLDSPIPAGQDADHAVKEIAQHPESGIWNATLSNGIELWATTNRPSSEQGPNEAMDRDRRLSITATIWGQPIDQLVGKDELVSSALSAWNSPATENRSRAAVGAYINEYGIQISAKHAVGSVQIQINAPIESETHAVELLYALLDKPMIELDTFDRWQTKHRDRAPDLIETGIKKLYCRDQSCMSAAQITLDDAQRTLSRICQTGEIDIALAYFGDDPDHMVDGPSMIERAAPYFARLHRVSPAQHNRTTGIESSHVFPPARSTITPEFESRSVAITTEHADDQGFAVGYLTEPDHDLERTRTLVLSSVALDQQFKALAKHLNLDASISVQLASTDLLDGRSVLLFRVRCDQEQTKAMQELVNTAADTLLIDGLDEEVFDSVKSTLVDSIDQFIGYPQFWSQRLSNLRVGDHDINDLWGMKQGYAEITPAQANAALHELLLSADRFTITITDDD